MFGTCRIEGVTPAPKGSGPGYVAMAGAASPAIGRSGRGAEQPCALVVCHVNCNLPENGGAPMPA